MEEENRNCIDCGKKLGKSAGYNNKIKRCHSCENKRRHKLGILNSKGKSNPNFGNRYAQKNYCIDCGKEISKQATRCGSCAVKEAFKNPEDNSNYIDGRSLKKNFCVDCNKQIGVNAKRCRVCYLKINRGKNCSWFGKHHTEEAKRKISEANKGKNNAMFGKIAGRAKWTKYKSKWFRSVWEVLFAQFLDLSGIKWQYEPKTFDLGNTTYTPDFYIAEWDCYIEIKGWWRFQDKSKFKIFRKKYFNTNTRVLMKKELQEFGVLI